MQIAAPGGCFFMRTIVFIDGQNLYHLAKNAWVSPGKAVYSRPSYDVRKLSQALVDEETGRTLTEIRFYTGVPDPRLGRRQKSWHTFWTYKIIHLRRQGIYVYRGRVNVGGQEKGVDVSLAIDLIQATYEARYEAALIVSQDSDFGPAVRLAKQIAMGQSRMLSFESWYPVGPGSRSRRGVPGTTWRPIEKEVYDACLDSRDYRPKRVSLS